MYVHVLMDHFTNHFAKYSLTTVATVCHKYIIQKLYMTTVMHFLMKSVTCAYMITPYYIPVIQFTYLIVALQPAWLQCYTSHPPS